MGQRGREGAGSDWEGALACSDWPPPPLAVSRSMTWVVLSLLFYSKAQMPGSFLQAIEPFKHQKWCRPSTHQMMSSLLIPTFPPRSDKLVASGRNQGHPILMHMSGLLQLIARSRASGITSPRLLRSVLTTVQYIPITTFSSLGTSTHSFERERRWKKW
jgi:hypothetical protein